jgi:hypothetical protein
MADVEFDMDAPKVSRRWMQKICTFEIQICLMAKERCFVCHLTRKLNSENSSKHRNHGHGEEKD